MTPLPIDPSPLPLDELLAFFAELSQCTFEEQTGTEPEALLANFTTLKAKHLAHKGYEAMSLDDFYHLSELTQAGLSAYVLDPLTRDRVSPVLKVIPGTPHAPEVGFILAYHDSVHADDALHQNLRYGFLTQGKVQDLHPNAIFFKLNRHASLMHELETYHNSVERENLYAEQPRPIGVLARLSAPITVSEHFLTSPTFWDDSGAPSAAARYCGTLFTGANGERLFKPILDESDCVVLSATEERNRYWVGDYVRVNESEYEIADVSLTREATQLTQTLKGPTGAVLVKDLPVAGNDIKLSDRGMLWRYCYDRPEFTDHQDHLTHAIQLGNYVLLTKDDGTPYTHHEALEALLTGRCDHIQFEENLSGWVCVRFGDQQGLRSVIQEKIQELKERPHV